VLSLVRLWAYAAGNKPSGDLSGMHTLQIVAAARYPRADGEAWVATLVEIAFLDGSPGAYALHDWAEHQPWATATAARSNAARQNAHSRWRREGRGHQPTEWCDGSCLLIGNAKVPIGNAKVPIGNAKVPIGNAPSPAPAPAPSPSPAPAPAPASLIRADLENSTAGTTVRTLAPAGAQRGVMLPQVQQEASSVGIRIEWSGIERERFSRLFPVERWELDHALLRAREEKAHSPGFVLSVIERDRAKSAELADQPRGPGAPQQPPITYSKQAEGLRRTLEFANNNTGYFDEAFDAKAK